jgi:hypothetical protein
MIYDTWNQGTTLYVMKVFLQDSGTMNLKSEGINGDSWGTIWMRIDDNVHGTNGMPRELRFSNLQGNGSGPDKSVKGTTGWQNYSVVLDVTEGATNIFLGFALHGSGAVWMSGAKFEVVGNDVPVTTVREFFPAPTNLGFEKE